MASLPLRENSLLSLEESTPHALAELLIAISVTSLELMGQQTTATLLHRQEAAEDLHQQAEDHPFVEMEALPHLPRQEPPVLIELLLRKERRLAVMIALRLEDHAKTRSLCADPCPLTATILTEDIHADTTLTSATC